MSFRILHVDDDSDIRKIVELSLGLDSNLTLVSCGNGADALAIASEWKPDLILCDFMMPGMDGPTVLTRLRECPATEKTPVVFMTARVESPELRRLMSLGAAAVFTKPFDPMTLAEMVRDQLYAAKSDAVRYDFTARMHADAALLATYRKALSDNLGSTIFLDGFQSCVHKLSGAAGVFNFQTVSRAASSLEVAIVERHAGRGTLGNIEANLDVLLECIARQ
jgi:CheY-like chemotaxis protein